MGAMTIQGLGEQRLLRALPRGHWWIPESLLVSLQTEVFKPTLPEVRSDTLIGRADVISHYLAYLNEILRPLHDYPREGEPIDFGPVVKVDGKTICIRMYDSLSRLFVLGYIDFQPFPNPTHPPGMLFGHGVYIQDLAKLTELRDCLRTHNWGNGFAPLLDPPILHTFLESIGGESTRYPYNTELLNLTVNRVKENILKTAS